MRSDITILMAEDDPGHATLIQRNLKRSGIENDIVHFEDGGLLLDFLFKRGDGPMRESHKPYVVLLDIRMPGIDGLETLRQIREDDELKKLPVIMLTTTDDPIEIDRCHALGCSNYITKPVDYDAFRNVLQELGRFLQIVQYPYINGAA